MYGIPIEVEGGGVVPVLSCVGTVAGLGYLDFADEG